MNTNTITIKKILLSGLASNPTALSNKITSLLHELLSLFHITADHLYIQSAAEYILAYLELGLGYLEHQALFDEILHAAGYSCLQILELQKQNPILILNKSQIRSVMGKWPASPYNSHTIVEAVQDILYRTKNGIQGSALYYTAKKDGTYTALFQLTITHDYALLQDVFRNKFYQLEKNEMLTVNQCST